MANECVPFKETGLSVTAKAAGAIVGKTFVKISGNRTGGGAAGLGTDLANVYQVVQCTAAAKAFGVAQRDAASGSLVGVYTSPGLIVPVTAGATINAGQEVEVDANGKAVPFSAGIKVGLALTGASAAADAEIKLY